MARFRQSTAAAFEVAILVLAIGSAGTARSADLTGPTPTPQPGGILGGTKPAAAAFPLAEDSVRLRGRWFEKPVRRAVQGAVRRLAEPACAAVLGDFHNGSGRALTEPLRALGLAAPDYARTVLFYDGSNDAACRRPRVYAFTSPGSRVVYACPTLGALFASRPDEAEAVVIHEMLHTLGLEDDLPSSGDVTAAVERRCRPSYARRSE